MRILLLQLLQANYIELCRASISCLFSQFFVLIIIIIIIVSREKIKNNNTIRSSALGRKISIKSNAERNILYIVKTRLRREGLRRIRITPLPINGRTFRYLGSL